MDGLRRLPRRFGSGACNSRKLPGCASSTVLTISGTRSLICGQVPEGGTMITRPNKLQVLLIDEIAIGRDHEFEALLLGRPEEIAVL